MAKEISSNTGATYNALTNGSKIVGKIMADSDFRIDGEVEGEAVVVGEGPDLVPGVVHRIDFGIVGPPQFVLELHVVGRIGKYHIHGCIRQRLHVRDAIAFDHAIDDVA